MTGSSTLNAVKTFVYEGGILDLSGMTNIDGKTVYTWSDVVDCYLGTDILLPAGYTLYKGSSAVTDNVIEATTSYIIKQAN